MTGPLTTLGAFLAVAAFLYPLGEVARRALFPAFALDAARRVLVALALGSSGLSLAVAVAWMAGNTLATALPVAAILFTVLAAAAVARARRGMRAAASETPVARGARSRQGLVIAVALAASIVPLLFYADPLTPIDDSLDHVASLSRRVAENSVFPRSDVYAASRESGPDLRKGLFHAVVALIARTAGIPVLALWNALPLVFAAWALLGVWSAARTVTRERGAPLVAVVVFLLTYDGGLGGAWLTRIGHPGRAITGPLWAVWALVLDPALRVPRLLWPLLGFGLAAMHSYSAIQIGVTAAFFATFVLLAGRPPLRATLVPTLTRVALVLAGAAPYLAFRAIDSGPALDTIHTEPQGLLYWTRSLFTLNPHWILWGWGAAGLVALPAAVGLLGRARTEPAAAFLASGMLGPVATIANPAVMPLVYRAIGYLGARFTWFTPHLFVIADALAGAWARARTRRREPGEAGAAAWRAFAVPGLILVTLAAGVAAAIPALVARQPLGGPSERGFLAQRDAFAEIDRAIPSPAVIVSDPATGYAIPALTRHWTLSASPQHTTPNDPDARARLRDTRRILSPYVGRGETVRLLRAHGVGYVLLNDTPLASELRYMWFASRRCHAVSRTKFDASPDLFEPILETGSLRLYRVTEAAREGPISRPDDAIAAVPIGSATREAGRPTGIPGYEFLDGTVGAQRLRAGEILVIATRWLKTQEGVEGNRHLVLRLDRQGKSLLPSDSPFARLARIASDSQRGERTRSRIDYVPGCGFLPPDDWPQGRALHDASEIAVPRGLSPGVYSVRVKLVETPFYPNVSPADFFAPLGDYDGFLLGEVEVLPLASRNE